MRTIFFSVGYNNLISRDFINEIEVYSDKISEIYFSFGGFANGRGNLFSKENSVFERDLKQIEDLRKLNQLGLKFNFLLNGNCYGKDAQARSFFCEIGDTIDYLKEICNVSCVTTTSPLIAKFIKQNFDNLEVRASVNMEIGNAEGMDYISEFFDSFYLKREYNRDINKIKSARLWCDNNGKNLYGLANSGCLNYCSVHNFHDNLVAHESEISKMDNAYQFEGQCWEYLKNQEKCNNWLRISNFIRPEDVHLYEGLFDGLKLATRVNKNLLKIVKAYCNGSYNGAVTELLEPDHSSVFYPCVIDNKSIASDFTNTVMNCSKNCNDCKYCGEVQKNATVVLE
ncbi:MAG: hypothetical protein IKK55_00270 [Clostridia bacterium]|nr:hypothetical protein [Clostridia bacterium]